MTQRPFTMMDKQPARAPQNQQPQGHRRIGACWNHRFPGENHHKLRYLKPWWQLGNCWLSAWHDRHMPRLEDTERVAIFIVRPSAGAWFVTESEMHGVQTCDILLFNWAVVTCWILLVLRSVLYLYVFLLHDTASMNACVGMRMAISFFGGKACNPLVTVRALMALIEVSYLLVSIRGAGFCPWWNLREQNKTRFMHSINNGRIHDLWTPILDGKSQMVVYQNGSWWQLLTIMLTGGYHFNGKPRLLGISPINQPGVY